MPNAAHSLTWFLRRIQCFALDLPVTPASRRSEVALVRLRLMAEPGPRDLDDECVAIARRLRELRVQMIRLIGSVQACGDCARGCKFPHGAWPGGYCCGGVTEHLFTQDELACLRASGTMPRNFRAPRSAHAGCAFRGARGCSLHPAHRPNLCVRYACKSLWDEYETRGIAGQVRAISTSIHVSFTQFTALRQTQRSHAIAADMYEALRPDIASRSWRPIIPARMIPESTHRVVNQWTDRTTDQATDQVADRRAPSSAAQSMNEGAPSPNQTS